tara:strand:- start:139 stop:486 length:348 start_codon:yes stop_codon:yes gene_type:complete
MIKLSADLNIEDLKNIKIIDEELTDEKNTELTTEILFDHIINNKGVFLELINSHPEAFSEECKDLVFDYLDYQADSLKEMKNNCLRQDIDPYCDDPHYQQLLYVKLEGRGKSEKF